MTDPVALLALASSALIAFAIASIAGLRAWHGWLELKRLEIAARRTETMPPSPTGSPTGRIELADLKERVRKLEAIASGIDLG